MSRDSAVDDVHPWVHDVIRARAERKAKVVRNTIYRLIDLQDEQHHQQLCMVDQGAMARSTFAGVEIYDDKSGRVRALLHTNDGAAEMCVMGDGRFVTLVGDTIKVWNANFTLQRQMPSPAGPDTTEVTLCNVRVGIFAMSHAGGVCVVDDSDVIRKLDNPRACKLFAAGSRTLVCVSPSVVRLWDTVTWTLRHTIHVGVTHIRPVSDTHIMSWKCIDSDGTLLRLDTGLPDGAVRCRGYPMYDTCVISANRMASAHGTRVLVWNTKTGHLECILPQRYTVGGMCLIRPDVLAVAYIAGTLLLRVGELVGGPCAMFRNVVVVGGRLRATV